MEDALQSIYGNGRHQIKVQILGVLGYVLGSQILTMMPFLQLYPALLCPDGHGHLKSCKRELACSDYSFEYLIDWSEHISLKNWMTELDLICIEPAKIGMMGIITFVSVGVGAIMFGGLIDSIGRRNVLLATLAVMPAVQIFWLLFLSLPTIYIGLFMIGICYSVRSSVAYVYTTECLLSAQKLPFCVY